MKTRYLLMVLFLMVFISCKKEKVAPDARYDIYGAAEISVPGDGSIEYPITVKYTSGDKRNIELSLSGLPSQSIYEIHNGSGTPPFNATIKIYANGVAEGSYTLKITAKEEAESTVSHSFMLNITSSYASKLKGGKWVQQKQGMDVNGNHQLDSLEIGDVNFPEATVYEFYENGKDGITYIPAYPETVLKIIWAVKNGYLDMGYPRVLYIEKLNDTELVLKSNDEYGHTIWSFFQR